MSISVEDIMPIDKSSTHRSLVYNTRCGNMIIRRMDHYDGQVEGLCSFGVNPDDYGL